MPDDLVYEATSSVYQLPEILVNAYASGSVFVSHPVHQIVPCPMDLQHFPFDEQECEFTYGSWMNHGWLVDTQPYGSEDDGWAAFVFGELFEANTEYDLVEVRSEHGDTFYGCCVEPYPTISYSFKVRRHARTYVSGILLPMVLATYAGFLAFARAGQESEIPNFKGSYLGRFPLVSADFWTSDHLLERSRSVDAFSGTRARGTLTLKRR